ncbi:MAG: HlyC/CorC family transporter [Roseitalea sp.]|jgi:CBS domain containing-hemolysin-like protein|nr:HlyC/CorC family transporter [Roseitalea sp.]MBO6744901.1 HlyC/CorC family transporter [Roseitalea sp.]
MEDRQTDVTARDAPPEPEPEPSSPGLPAIIPPRKPPGFFQRLAFLFRPQDSVTMRENLQDALAASGAAGDQTISADERAMLHNILRLREVRVVDVMVPRGDIEAVDLSTSLGDLLKLFETSGHSRMPVYNETLDDPRGMVHIRDVVAYLTRTGRRRTRRPKAASAGATTSKGAANGRTNSAAKAALDLSRIDFSRTIGDLKLMRDVLFVPPSMLASDLMGRMQTQRIQMALVIDEYGGTDGLVSLEDIVEIVVGDIEDEHDEVEVQIERADENTVIVDARLELEEAGRELGPAFVEAARREEGDVDTIGGLIFSLLGHVPVRGEVIPSFAGYEMEVLDADPRRIRRVRLVRLRQHQRRGAGRRDSAHTPPRLPAPQTSPPDTPPAEPVNV